MANASVYASTASLAANLQRALESRAVIDQTKGVLMGRHGISADAAFEMLARESQSANRKLRDIAGDLVDDVQQGGPGTRSKQAPGRRADGAWSQEASSG